MKEYYIRMVGMILPESVDILLGCIDKQMHDGCDRIHLMLSTPGGAVAPGLMLANYISAIPIEVYTYNIGAVDSIGVAVYSSGKRRFCCRECRFMLHHVTLSFIENQNFDEKTLMAKLEEITIDTQNIAEMISRATSMSVDEVLSAMRRKTILNAKTAVACALSHEIRTADLLPRGARFCTISPDCSVIRYDAKETDAILDT